MHPGASIKHTLNKQKKETKNRANQAITPRTPGCKKIDHQNWMSAECRRCI